jgi:hypothetical protein
MMKFSEIKVGARFRKLNGKRLYIKAPFPFGGDQMGGRYQSGWKAFEDTDAVELI